jgi:hypothetical protein
LTYLEVILDVTVQNSDEITVLNEPVDETGSFLKIGGVIGVLVLCSLRPRVKSIYDPEADNALRTTAGSAFEQFGRKAER